MFWLLVACGIEGADSAGSDPAVSVAPVYLSRAWGYTTLNCDANDPRLSDTYGTVYVVNDGSESVEVVALSTASAEDVAKDDGTTSWLEVSPNEDVIRDLAPGAQMEITYLALGSCSDVAPLDRGIHSFDLVVTVGGVDTIVRADVILETAE